MKGAKADLRPDRIRIALERLQEIRLRRTQRLDALQASSTDRCEAFEDQFMDIRSLRRPTALGSVNRNMQLAGKSVDDLCLHGVAILVDALETAGPDLQAGLGVDQGDIHAQDV